MSGDNFSPGLDDAFGHWLAGFIDGEGCFVISHQASRLGGAPVCFFQLVLRADDADILVEAQQRTGLGLVKQRYLAPDSGTGSRGNTRPQAIWRIGARRECLALADLLERYPLRAKKRRDAVIWSEAIRESWRVFTTQSPGHRDFTRVWALRDELRRVREWTDDAVVEPDLDCLTTPAQMRLVA